MKTFTKDSFIDLVIMSQSDFVVAKGTISHTFTVRLKTTELQSGIGDDDSKIFTQHWALNGIETLDSVDYFIFQMWGYPPSHLNNYTDTLRFEGKQFRVTADAIVYIIEKMKNKGLENYQTNILKRMEVLGDYIFSQKKTFGSEILNIAKEKEGKIAVLILEFDKKPQLPSDLFIDDFQNFQRKDKIVFGKMFSGKLTATTQKITVENDSKIHPVPERSEKDYLVELFFEDGNLTAKYFDDAKQKSFSFTASSFGIM